MNEDRRIPSGVFRASVGALGLAAILFPCAGSALTGSRWVPPTTISTIGGDALTAQVAVDSAGNALAIWARSKGRTWLIQAAYRPFGGPWQPPSDLSSPSSLAGAPQVTFDAEGNAVAVWERSDGNRLVVQAAARARASGRWSIPEDLARSGGDSLSPQVAVDADGNALAVWVRSSGGVWAVQSSVRPRGSLWQPAETVDRTTAGAVSPHVVFDVRGNAVAAWAALAGTNWSIVTAERARDGGWDAPELLAAAGEYPRVRLQLAVDGRGSVFALWEGLNGLHPVVQASVRSASGQRWSVVRDLSDDTSDAVSPELAVDAGGDVVAVWARTNGRNWVVQAAQRRAGKSWEPPRTVSSSGRDAVAPDVALDPRGNALAVWTRSNGSNTIVQSSYRPRATGVWSPARSLSAPGGDAVTPAVAMDGRGNGTLVWSRFNGRAFLTQASGYDAEGPELRDLSVPAGGVAGEALSFSVRPLDAWSAVTATRWTFGDGSRASGTTVDHVYARPGRHTVRVTSIDSIGLLTTATRSIAIRG